MSEPRGIALAHGQIDNSSVVPQKSYFWKGSSLSRRKFSEIPVIENYGAKLTSLISGRIHSGCSLFERQANREPHNS
jgi:hypothetical protein